MAQTLRHYRLVDIGLIAPDGDSRKLLDMQEQQENDLGESAPADVIHQNSLGINAYGEVVGGIAASDEGPVHAFVWLPIARLGLSAGLHDLHVLAHGSTDEDWSFANDINDAGLVVGQKGVDVSETCLARLWTLGSTITTASLHTTTGDFSAASDINDASPAVVVGETSVECVEAVVDRYHRGFVRTTASSDSMVLLDPTEGNEATRAYAVRDATPQYIVGGAAGKLAFDPFGSPCAGPTSAGTTSCFQPDNDAMGWSSSLGGPLANLSSDPFESWGAEAFGVNESGDAVGFSWVEIFEEPPVGGTLCPYRAVYWEIGTSMPVDLSEVLDESTPPRSRANDVTERDLGGCVTVVGADLQNNAGTIWYGQGPSDWCAADLNDLTFSTCAPANGRQIERAWAVNNRRHIAVEFVKTTPQGDQHHAGILTDIADLNGDLRVNYTDLCILYASYTISPSGNCDPHPEADLNCDGVVDADDRSVLVARWSGDGIVGIGPICDCEGGESLLGPDVISTAVAEAIDLLGLDPAEFDPWARTATIGEVDAAGQFIEDWVTLTTGQEGQS